MYISKIILDLLNISTHFKMWDCMWFSNRQCHTWGSAFRDWTWQLTLSAVHVLRTQSCEYTAPPSTKFCASLWDTYATGLKLCRISICEKRCSFRHAPAEQSMAEGKPVLMQKRRPTLIQKANQSKILLSLRSVYVNRSHVFFTLHFTELQSISSCITLRFFWNLSLFTTVHHHLRLLCCVWKSP